jgi:hypothetical protein
MKTFFSRWMADRIERRSRAMRRSLRDFQRRESASISALEKRSRGLRLYAAWIQNENAIGVRKEPERWSLTRIPATT